MNRIPFIVALAAPLALTQAAGAADFDGSKTLLCAPSEAVDCLPREDCEQRSPDQIGISRFVTVDFKKKQLSGKRAGEEKYTAIQNISSLDGKQILQGAENGRGWSLVIDEKTGDFSAAIADQAAGFVLFGACTPK